MPTPASFAAAPSVLPTPPLGSASQVPTPEEMATDAWFADQALAANQASAANQARAAWLSNRQGQPQWEARGSMPLQTPEPEAAPVPPTAASAQASPFARAVVVPVVIPPSTDDRDQSEMAQERWKTPQDAWPSWPPVEFGAQSPMPGRESDFETYLSQNDEGQGADNGYLDVQGRAGPSIAAETAGVGRGSMRPPPIDEERLRSSPGLQKNFYDVPTADFKRPFRPPRR